MKGVCFYRRSYSTRHVAIRVEIRARAQFFDPIFEGNFGGLLVLKMGHAAYRRKAPDVYFLKTIILHGSEFGGKRYHSRKSGRLSCFFRAFPAKIPVNRGMPPANREFHVVAGVVIFPTHPGPHVNLQQVGKTLCARGLDSRESELGLVRYGPANRGHRGVFGPLEDIFPIGIPARPGKFLAIRAFHVVHGCVFFPTFPVLRINLLRVRKTLCASVATSVGKFWNFQQNLISLACFHARGRRSSRCQI